MAATANGPYKTQTFSVTVTESVQFKMAAMNDTDMVKIHCFTDVELLVGVLVAESHKQHMLHFVMTSRL